MRNDKIDTWVFIPNVIPEYGKQVFILIECDVIDEDLAPDEQYQPIVEKAVLKKGEDADFWELTNVSEDDPNQEKILQQVYTVTAWRYVD